MAQLRPVEDAREPQGRKLIEVSSPATLEVTGRIELATGEDVRRAVDRAHEAAAGWAELSFRERGRHLLRLRGVILERMDRIVETICRDTGKPRLEAVGLELLGACAGLGRCARNAGRLLRDTRRARPRFSSKKLSVAHRPRGVIGVLAPSSLPFRVSLDAVARALAAGNAVVLKPSEVAPLVGSLLGELFEAAALPEEVVRVVTGDASAGAALVEAGCDGIFFAGSARAGREVARACGARLIPCVLDAGGTDAMIVCGDANLERAAQGAVWAAFSSTGRACRSVVRVLVAERVLAPFVARVVALSGALRQGPEEEGEIDVGALPCLSQVERIGKHVNEAVAAGAAVLAGGRRNPRYRGCFYEPTVLTGVGPEMAILRAEVSGPVLPVQVVAEEEEAVRLVNRDGPARNVSLWTRDYHRGRELASGIRARCVVVDDLVAVNGAAGDLLDLGTGGKAAGPDGWAGLRAFCWRQAVAVHRLRARGPVFRYPYSGKKLRMLHRLVHLLHGSPVGKLLAG